MLLLPSSICIVYDWNSVIEHKGLQTSDLCQRYRERRAVIQSTFRNWNSSSDSAVYKLCVLYLTSVLTSVVFSTTGKNIPPDQIGLLGMPEMVNDTLMTIVIIGHLRYSFYNKHFGILAWCQAECYLVLLKHKCASLHTERVGKPCSRRYIGVA